MELIAGRTRIGTYHEIAASTDGIALIAPVTLAPNGSQPDQRLTVDDTVRQFTAFDAETSAVYWTSEDAPCRVTFDGSDPTTTNGHIIPAGASGTWSVALAAAARFIRNTGTSAIIHASQLR
jgi:hypothetical protein